ncbi:hypothetical protein K4F52_008391 [Lecanicillium sp. MT-2017a]|nr:hypothetical protein K4F52_008391 [Lecanicillium sp. MT-2017a]
MSNLELPPGSSLDDSCTVIHDNTLFSYSSQGFLALPLEEGGEWKKLDAGQSVTGGVCVGANLEDPAAAALFIVGGQGPDNYNGLQRYDFASSKWAAPITPAGQSEIVKNRQGHGAVYNKAANSIVVFGGTRDGSAGASAETYTISASEPYTGVGRDAGGAAPGKKPLLFQWGTGADIVMVGGVGAASGKVYLYNPEVGWRDFGASLAQPFATDSAAIKATMIEGTDGSQNLLVFDLSKSPNTVDRLVIRDAKGNPVVNSEPVSKSAKRAPSMRLRHRHIKRDLTQQNWPSYDSSSAPTDTRTNYALAKGPDGMIVFSGGNDDSPIAMFDANKEDGWLDNSDKFGALDVTSTSSSTASSTSLTTSSSTPTSTTSFSTLTTSASSTANAASSTTPAQTSAAAAPGKESDGPSSNAILGITLGTIGGFLLILLVILLLLKRRKNRMNANQGNVLNPDEKDTVAFAKSTQPSASPAHYRGHQPQLSQESYSSVAILMGRMGPQKAGMTRKPSHDSSRRSSVSSLHKQFKSTISKPIPQQTNNPILQGHDDKGVAFAPTVAEPRPRNGPMEAQDGTRRSSGWNRYWSGGSALQILGYGSNKRGTVTSEQSSHYSETANQTNHANPRATQDSATVPPLNFEGRPEVNSVNTGSPVVSQYTSKVPTEGIAGTIERPVSPLSSVSGYSSGVPESINEMWENRNDNKPWGTDRAPSSIYQHSKSDSASAPAPASGVSQQPQLAMAAKSSDMSWLNLGEQSRN